MGNYFCLPKLVVIVPDDDLIKLLCTEANMKGFSKPMSRIINYIMTEHERCIAAFREYLPAKALKQGYPHFLWIQAPEHKNFLNNSLQHKFNKCLESCSGMHANTTSLMLKKVWTKDDGTLFLHDSQRFTSEGFTAYWEAVDRTVRYMDAVILKKFDKIGKKPKISGVTITGQKGQFDHFRWQNLKFNLHTDVSCGFRTLPPPP